MIDPTPNLLTLTFPRIVQTRPAFHCPACGVRSLGGESPELLACEHLLFVYLREIGAFLHHDQPFKDTFDALRSRMIRELRELEPELSSAAGPGSDGSPARPCVQDLDVIEEFLRQVERRGTTIFGVQLTTEQRTEASRPSTLLIGYRLVGDRVESLEVIRREISGRRG